MRTWHWWSWLASRSRQTNKKSLPWTVGIQPRPSGVTPQYPDRQSDRQTDSQTLRRLTQMWNQFFRLDLPIVNLSGFVKKEGESSEDCSANNLRMRTEQGASVGRHQGSPKQGPWMAFQYWARLGRISIHPSLAWLKLTLYHLWYCWDRTNDNSG